MLVDLPARIACSILTQWLGVGACGKLDAAYCNTEQRTTFLEYLTLTQGMQLDRTILKFWSSIRWMVKRNVQICAIEFTSAGRLTEEKATLLESLIHNSSSILKVVSVLGDHEGIEGLLELVELEECSLEQLTVSLVGCSDGMPAVWHQTVQTIVTHSAQVLTDLCIVSPMYWIFCFGEGAHFPALRKLKFSIGSDLDLMSICKASPNLIDFHIMHPTCSNVGFESLAQHCRDLEVLRVMCPSGIDNVNVAVAALAMGCKKLKVLSLEVCGSLSDIGLTAVATHCTQLQELTITDSVLITDAPLIALAHSRSAATLTSLTLKYIDNIVGTGIVAIAQHCTQLRSLELHTISALTPAALRIAITHLANVSKFQLSSCYVEGPVLRRIAKHMPLLEHFSIAENGGPCPNTETGFAQVVKRCEKLVSLRVVGCEPEDELRWLKLRPGLIVYRK